MNKRGRLTLFLLCLLLVGSFGTVPSPVLRAALPTIPTLPTLNAVPVAVADTIDPRTRIFLGGQAALIDVLANDQANGDPLQVVSVTQPAANGGWVINHMTAVSYTAPQANGEATFTYQAGNGRAHSDNAPVTVSYVATYAPGDCNGNGSVTAADLISIGLEIFDSDDTRVAGNPAWWLVHTGSYAGTPLGCDANVSTNGVDNRQESVTAADIICLTRLLFADSCGGSVAASPIAGQPAIGAPASAQTLVQLTIPTAITASANASVTVPVAFQNGGHVVGGIIFSLDFDEQCLAFDATDGDNNGLPDAVQFNTPAAFRGAVVYHGADTDGELDVTMIDYSVPIASLPDNAALLAVTFTTICTPVAGTVITAPVRFSQAPAASFSDPTGLDVAGSTTNGSVTIQGAPANTPTPMATSGPDLPTPLSPAPPTATPTLIPTIGPDTPTPMPPYRLYLPVIARSDI